MEKDEYTALCVLRRGYQDVVILVILVYKVCEIYIAANMC